MNDCISPRNVIYYICIRIATSSRGLAKDIQLNRLWKLLIDKRITKTEMCKAAGISTNILAKMGKDELVAMDTLAKICVTLDDIAEINSDTEKGGEK